MSKNVLFIGIFCLMMSTFVQIAGGQNKDSLVYDKQRNTLALDSKLLPYWLEMIIDLQNPSIQYNFIKKDSVVYALKGWNSVDIPLDLNEHFKDKDIFTPSKKDLAQGWFYAPSRVQSLGSGWYFSPKYSLYFNKDGIFKLDHFFTKELDSIKTAQQDQPNKVKVGEFIKIVINMDQNSVDLKYHIPKNWVLAYVKKFFKIGEGQFVAVFLAIDEPKNNPNDLDPQDIKLDMIYKNTKITKKFHYKVFFDLKSQLISY